MALPKLDSFSSAHTFSSVTLQTNSGKELVVAQNNHQPERSTSQLFNHAKSGGNMNAADVAMQGAVAKLQAEKLNSASMLRA